MHFIPIWYIFQDMLSVLNHQITLQPLLISKNWNNYKRAYQEIENLLPAFHDIPNNFIYKYDILLGFQLPRITNLNYSLPLQKLLKTKDTYSLNHERITYSRGMKYYPGLNKHFTENEKLTTIYSNIYEILSAYEKHIKESTNDIYIVIAEDYIRNYLLILYQAYRTLSFKYIFLNESNFEFEFINDKFREGIQSTITVLFSHLTDKKSSTTLQTKEIANLCNSSHKIISRLLEQQQDFVTQEHNSIIRESREIDSLRHLYIFAKKIAKHRLSSSTCLIGIEYGGLELPFAVNAVRILDSKQELKTACVRASHYSSNTTQKISTSDLVLFKNEQKNVQSAQSFWILDDSITTGRSIAQISASLPKHAKKAIIGIVTFKVSHRFHHLVMNNHGGFNPVLARNAIILCKSNYAPTYKQNSYLDRRGKFNINKDALYKILGEQYV